MRLGRRSGLYLLVIFILIICAFLIRLPNKANNDKPSPINPSELSSNSHSETVITFAYLTSGNGSDMQQLVDSYNKTHSDVRVEMLSLSSDRYSEMVNMMMASGKGPDIMSIHHDWIITYMNKNWLLDMTPYIDSQFLAEYPEWAKQYGKINGKYYTFPTRMVTTRLIYNKDMFLQAGLDPDKPPKTLEELVYDSDVITKSQLGTAKRGFAIAGGEDWKGFVQSMEIANTYSGSYLYNYLKGNYDITIYKPWLSSMIAMRKQESLYPGEVSLKYDTAFTQFTEGNIAMLIANSGDLSVLAQSEPLSFEWGVSFPPATDVAHSGQGALMMFPEPTIGINSSTPYKKEVTEFWEYLHDKQQLSELFHRSCIPSIVKGINDNDIYKPSIPNCDKFMPSSLDSFYPREPIWLEDYGTVRAYDDPNAGWTPRMQVYRDILSGKVDIDIALQNETARLNNQLQRAITESRLNLAPYVILNFNPLKPLENQSGSLK
ncbi:hypothetical protein A8709_13550 [Paenibacillus pectinilyticus]|uniref:ABC transporter substrate-binding protein n=1 Tax=Paenibacillus pectinilyticus TaxID=512399 RepID=A0A1C1A3S5_9BACL|nr:extracellular solute-binding protein [Paenibacillus pectinilyticus]OCT15130.1 hypothetical protein A8709_13550 [Paenibacillus pectinilyticus]